MKESDDFFDECPVCDEQLLNVPVNMGVTCVCGALLQKTCWEALRLVSQPMQEVA